MPEKKTSKKLTERQRMKRDVGRDMSVFKRDDMIQESRLKLTVREQRCVLYTISRIKPTDESFQEYTFDIKDLYAVCGLETDSYTQLKDILNKLSDKSWDMPLKDNPNTISRVRWFSTLRMNKKSGRVTVKFHEDMMPYLLQLRGENDFYTGYGLRNVLPMKCRYAPRLYELLKSYQKNNKKWFFDADELRVLLDAEKYKKNFTDFKINVIEPAVEEINKYTDIKIAWEAKKEGVKYKRIWFYMKKKQEDELAKAQQAVSDVLDGQITFEERLAEAMAAEAESEDSVERRFFRDDE